MTNPIITRPNAFNTAVQGMQRAAERTATAAEDINRNFAAAQNARAADSVAVDDNRAAVAPAVEDAVRGAVLPPEGDLTQAVVDLLQARQAYAANAAVARVTADVEADILKLKR